MSDKLREALDRLKAMTPRDFRAYHDQIDAALAALSAPQADAEAVAWRFQAQDRAELRAWVYTDKGRPNENNGWVIEPLYTAPPSQSAGLRKALELAVNIIMANEPGDSRAVSDVAVALAAVAGGDTSKPVMAVIDKALSRADDGTKSEGGVEGHALTAGQAIARFGKAKVQRPETSLAGIKPGPSDPREAIARIKNRIDARLNDCLCEMKPDYDDSITGFNEAWDIVRKAFDEVLAPRGGE